MNKRYLYLILVFGIHFCESQNLAVLKYEGGGDWYSNPTALKNLIQFCNSNIDTAMDTKPQTVEVGSSAIFEYPFTISSANALQLGAPQDPQLNPGNFSKISLVF